MESLKNKINNYVNSYLINQEFQKIRAPKMIHDTIHGSNLFFKHEISILDLPLMQRLRYIHQVDLASLVFPSANHNRFEHSLGVVAVANKMLSSIQGKDIKLISNDDIMNVRMAALLHDCGHGPFSHMSEDNYRKCQDMIEALKEEK